MEKGISKYWTPEREARAQRLITQSPNFAVRHLLMTLCDMLKYDQRTRAGRRGMAQARLRLATATDKDLEEIAELKVHLLGEADVGTVEQVLFQLNKDRERVRGKGFKRSELECP